MYSRRLRIALSGVLLLAMMTGIGLYLYSHRTQLLDLVSVSTDGIFNLLALSLAFPVLNGLINTLMFRAMGAHLSHKEGILLAAAATLANQLPIPGGIVARGVYLKARYNMPYALYLSAAAALFVCTLAVNGFIGEVVLLWSAWTGGSSAPVSLLVGYGLMAMCIFSFLFPLRRLRVPARLGSWLSQAATGWAFLSREPALLVKLLGLQTALMMLFALRYAVAFRMLSQHVPFSYSVMLSAATVLTQLVSLAPGGLGVRELIVAGVAAALGLDLPASVAAVEVDRLVTTSTIVVVGWIATAALGRQLSVHRTPTKSRSV